MQEYSLVSILVMALLVITFIIFDIFRTQKKHSKDESGIFGHVGNETAFFSVIVLIISLILIKTKIIKEFVGMNQFFAFFIVLFLAVASLVLCILGVKGLRKILDEKLSYSYIEKDNKKYVTKLALSKITNLDLSDSNSYYH